MKALTNILSRLLLLLILATACARDLDTEVDTLTGKDEVLLTVNMQVPGLKVSTRADGAETLTDITALCFNENGELEKKETTTPIGASTFKIYVPKETRKIHFLANLPEAYSLGDVDEESDLTTLTTTDKANLSYWGIATFDGTAKSLSVNFYRNMAMITIAPGEDAVFGQNQLSIAGVVNGYNTGKLVPNREVNQNVSFDFNLSGEYDYYTLPTAGYTLTDDGEDKNYGSTAYVFEHPNTSNTLTDALHVICKIGDNYYKVALAYEDQQGEYHNYSIIRNHKYVIYVSDVCDVPQNLYSVNYNDVLGYDPINMEVVDVALRAFTQTSQLYFDGTSTKEMAVVVTIPPGVTGLNIEAVDFSSVKVGDTSLSVANGVYTYTCEASETEQKVTFTFTLDESKYTNQQEDTSTNITFSDAAQGSLVEKASVSITLKKTPKVQLTIQQQPQLTNSTLYYSETSREEFTMDVNVPAGVEQLQITAEDFNVSWATENNVVTGTGSTTYDNSDGQSKTVRLMFTLKDGVSSTDSPSTISITGSGEYVIVDKPLTTNITLQESAAPAEGSILYWQGAVELEYQNHHMTKIPIYYEDLKDLLPGSKIQLEYSDNGGWIGIYYPYALDGEQNKWDIVGNNNVKELELTEEILDNIKSHPDAGAYNHKNVGLIIQGADDRVLTKITIVPAKKSISANITNGSTLYYDSDDTQTATVQVTVPDGVETLNISAEDFSFGGEDDGEYTYAVKGQTNATLSFTLKSGLSARTSTITFSDASGNATDDAVNVNLVETPVVTFTPDETSKIMNINDTYTVTMDPNGGALTSLSIAAEGFDVTSSSGGLSGPTENVYTYAGGYTQFTFTPTSAGSYTISFSGGQGDNIKVSDKEIVVTVNADITAKATPSTIYYDGDNKDVTVSVTIPKGVSGLSISAPNFKYGEETGGSYTYTRNDGATTQTTVELTFTLNDGVTTDSSITFSDASDNDNVNGASVTILVKRAEIDVPVLVEGENILQLDELPLTLGNNNGIVLLKANGNDGSGLLESYRNYIAEKVTLKITFTSDGEANPLSFQTTWSGELEEEYSLDSSMKYLSYTFKRTDFEKGNGGENTIANAGLKLQAASNSNSTITAISIIIPASTTE